MTPAAVRFHPAAAQEAESAYDWYAARNPSAAHGFREELRYASRRCCRQATHVAPLWKPVRRYVFPRFPFILVYRLRGDEVEILAVAHGSMPASRSLNEDVKQHYTRPDLGTIILTALASAGKDLDALKPEDLAPIDQFHIRGRQATLELAQAAGVDASQYVLDVGSGIGGPSRSLAQGFGCRVAGIDLTDEYCRVATMLAERVGLS
jgi:plasmid stabilization system protein ParE